MVKFGHELADGMERLGLGRALAGLEYKELKKLLKYGASEEEQEQHIGFALSAAEVLQSSFWTWPHDGQDIEATSKHEWAAIVFERKLASEAKRVRANQFALSKAVDDQRELLSNLQAKVLKGNSTENDVRDALEIKETIARHEEQYNMYKLLNQKGFFKILKKYDKMYQQYGLSPRMSEMMFVIEGILNPDIVKPQSDTVDSSIQKLDEAFEQIMALAIESPKKAQRLSDLQHAQSGLCEEILAAAENMSEDTTPDPCEEDTSLNWQRLRSQFVPPLARAFQSEENKVSSFGSDLAAAIIISVAGIPKAMAYASLAGLPIHSGLATLYVPCLVYALIGSSRQVAISAQSVTCLLLAQIVDDALHGTGFEDDSAERVRLTMMYTFATGLVIFLFGMLRLGFLLNFISRPVLSGFVSASALIAIASTFKNLVGIKVEKSAILYEMVIRICANLPHAQLQTTLISIGGIILMVILSFLQKRGTKKLSTREKTPLVRTALTIMKVPGVFYLVLAGIFLGGGFCDFEAFSPWTKRHVIVGRGATFPALFYQHVIDKFNCQFYPEGVQIEYSASGSGDGLRSILRNDSVQIDFASSDIQPSELELQVLGVQSFPVVKSMLCPAVNLPLLEDSEQIRLILDMSIVADIFAGNIWKWSDPRILKLNPNLPWHLVPAGNDRITLIVRSDESGTTQSFAEALRTCTDCNSSAINPGLKVSWGGTHSHVLEAEGMGGVMSKLISTPWSIGYASFSEVMNFQGRDACAALATPEGTTTALLAWTNPTLTSWPIWQANYILVPRVGVPKKIPSQPRLDACTGQTYTNSFLEQLYLHKETAKDFHYHMEERPDIDVAGCGNSARRLAIPKTCKKPTPKCGKINMVGYIEPLSINFEIPKPQTSVPFSKILVDSLLLACIALLEHIANLKLYADRGGYDVSVSSDLMAVGLSNIFGCMSGSFIVAGGFSRSALNAKAKSQCALLLSVFISAGMAYAAAPLLSMLPDAILSVILFMAVIGLVDWKMVVQLVRLRRYGLTDMLALFIAFSATCFFGVVQGMASAIGFSLVMFVFNGSYPQIVQLERTQGTTYYSAVRPRSIPRKNVCMLSANAEGSASIKVLRFEAPLWFANSSVFLDRMLMEISHSEGLKGLVLDMSTVPWIDFSASTSVKKLVSRADELGVIVVFAHANEKTQDMIQMLCDVGKTSFFETNYSAKLALEGPSRKSVAYAGAPTTSPHGGLPCEYASDKSRHGAPCCNDIYEDLDV